MHIEVMIYVYMAVCTAMILFNCAMVVVNGRQKRHKDRPDRQLSRRISQQLDRLEAGNGVEEAHIRWIAAKLRHTENMRAFDANMELMQKAGAAGIQPYLEALRPVFLSLADCYCEGEPLKASYFAYVVRKYHMARRGSFDSLTEHMMRLLHSPSVYARENAIHIIYDLGDPDCAIRALHMLDNCRIFHHPKLIHDGLLEFRGDRNELLSALWKEFGQFSAEMQTALVNYMRLSGGGCDEQVFNLMTRAGQDDEVYFACMRYFGRFTYAPAYPVLLENLRGGEGRRWEFAAVAAAVLRNYPGQQTAEQLKAALHSSAWSVRANAAESLEALGIGYAELAAVFEGNDRYAREILQYRMDFRRAKTQEKEKEALTI